MNELPPLSRRERQIMDLLYANQQMSAQDVTDQLSDAPSYTTVRTLMRILEDKGHLKHHKSGRQFIYQPTKAPEKVRQSSLQHLLKTFFSGSISEAVATFIDHPENKLSEAELKELEAIVKKAKKK
jgi:predicted transcriptional regulator